MTEKHEILNMIEDAEYIIDLLDYEVATQEKAIVLNKLSQAANDIESAVEHMKIALTLL
jgi:hypothetical protein